MIIFMMTIFADNACCLLLSSSWLVSFFFWGGGGGFDVGSLERQGKAYTRSSYASFHVMVRVSPPFIPH